MKEPAKGNRRDQLAPPGTVNLLRQVIDQAPIAMVLISADGRWQYANPALCALIGYGQAECVGLTIDNIIHPEEREAAHRQLARLHRGELPDYTVERRYLRKDGSTLYGQSSIATLHGTDAQSPYHYVLQVIDIGAKKEAEAALADTKARWGQALRASQQSIIWDVDVPSGFGWVSPQWEAMLGLRDNQIRRNIAEWLAQVHPEDRLRIAEAYERARTGQDAVFDVVYRVWHKDGRWLWVLSRGKAVEFAADGAPLRIIGTVTDITREKEIEARLLAVTERLQIAVEAGGAGVFDYDFTTDRYDWDPRMFELYGLPPATPGPTMDDWFGLLHPDDVPKARREHEAAVGETSVFSLDFRVRQQRSGDIRHIRSLARLIRDETGAAVRAVGMNWDITDHRETAAALLQEKERLRITLHSIGDGVISTNADARITFMNPVAEEMTGWRATDAIGLLLREVFRLVDETGAPIPDPVETCLSRMQPFHLDGDAGLLGQNGERRHVRDSAAPVRVETGEIIGAVLVFQDVTSARTLQQALEHSANHDALTGLPNRTAFERGLRDARDQARREPHEHTLCFIDLDRFKIVNDGAGHAAGDALLREFANLLRRSCRTQDLAARLGGDEFALLLRDCPVDDGERIATRLLRDLAGLRFVWDGINYQIGASVGLVAVGAGAPRPDELVSQADIACYTAKTSGRNRIAVYGGDDSAAQRHHREIQVAAGIRNAIEAGRFRLFAQEIRSLRSDMSDPRHFEILLRLEDDSGTIVEPAAFIPASERYDLMGTIDRWVIRTALRDYGPRLQRAEDVTIAVNLSANSLNDPFLWPFLQEELVMSGLSPGRLRFEITETAVIDNLLAAGSFVSKARSAGCGVVLDDFGTGLSSFAYLRQFPVDALKIDGDFIRQMTESAVDRAIVESINAIGHRLGALTVAEQVEDDATLDLVRAMGIDLAQGFAIARPIPLDTIF